MGEGSIFSFYTAPFLGIGISIRKYNNYELAISLPFMGFAIEFKRKTENNDWFSFSNNGIF